MYCQSTNHAISIPLGCINKNLEMMLFISHRFLIFKVICTFCIGYASAQDRLIDSQVLDPNGQGIPYAAIGILEENFGTVSFEDGSFTLTVNDKYLKDSLVVSALGYERRKISYQQFINEKPKTITLQESIKILSEVVISPKKLTFVKIGNKKKKFSNSLSIFDPKQGAIVAVLFDDISESVLLREITVTTGMVNLDFFKMRCMVFSMDNDSLPGEQLLDKNLIQTRVKGKNVIRYTLEEDFWIDQPFYLGFEWIISKKQYEQRQKAQDMRFQSFFDRIKSDYLDLNFTIVEDKKIVLYTKSGKLVKELELTAEEKTLLKNRGEVIPRVFLGARKGSVPKTVAGSYITGKWRGLQYYPLVSILVGKEKGKP